jgi:excisionase family DNA binding protein
MGRRALGLLERSGVPENTPALRQPSPTLTPKQVAPVARMSLQTVYKAVRDGDLPGGKVRGRVVIFREEFCELYHLPYDYDFGPP